MSFWHLGKRLLLTPLNAGTGEIQFRTKVEQDFFQSLDAFKPQLFLVLAGFDSYTEDPLSNLNLIEDDCRYITTMKNDIADRLSESLIVSMLEGGYHLKVWMQCLYPHRDDAL